MEGRLTSSSHRGRIEEVLAQVDWVRGLVRRMLGEAREADVDDIVQDTMVQAISLPPDTDRPVRGWLATVARNLFRERHRSEGRRRRREKQTREPSGYPTPEEAALLAERQHLVVGAVLGLPEPYRHSLLLYHFHGMTAEEVAGCTGVSPATARSRLRRGREHLRDDMRERLGDGWAAALLPLALWPERLPPAPTSSAPATAARGWRVAAAIGLIGAVVAGVWWGDWWYDQGEPTTAVAVTDSAGTADGDTRRRRHVEPASVPSLDPGADSDAAATTGSGSADENAPELPGRPPPGTIRVRVEGLPEGLASPPRIVIQPFHATFAAIVEHGHPEPVTVALEESVVDLDLVRLFGPDLDLVDADVTLQHPDLMTRRVRAVAATDADPGLPAELPAVPAAIVAGRVLDSQGAAVAGAWVLAGRELPSAGSIPRRHVDDEVRSSDDGRYRLRVPPGAEVRVLASADGHHAASVVFTALGPGAEAAVDVVLPAGHTISGRVLLPEDRDASGLTVTAFVERYLDPAYRGEAVFALLEDGEDVQRGTRAPVAPDGTFVLRGLSARAYTVAVEPEISPHRAREASRVVVPAPSTDVELDLRLVDVPFVVRDASGPVAGVAIGVSEVGGGALGGARSGADGRVVVSLRRGLDVRWTASTRNRGGREGVLTTPESGPAAEVPVTLEPGSDATWHVRLEHPDGTPVTHAAFDVRPQSGGRRWALPIEVDSDDGTFVLEGLPRGPQTVTIRVAPSWEDGRAFWRDLRLDVSLPDAGPVRTLVPRERGGRMRIEVASEGGEMIFARATLLRDGTPVPCTFSCRQYGSAKNASTMLSSLAPNDVQPVLAPGEYELLVECATHPPRPPQRRTVTVREGEVTDVDVVFPAR